MSIDIRYLTNGIKSVVVVRNAGVTPTSYEYYDKPEDVPHDIRHYCPKEVRTVGPGLAAFFKVRDILYPHFPDCKHPDYPDSACIAEECKYAKPTYHECPYFDKKYKGV